MNGKKSKKQHSKKQGGGDKSDGKKAKKTSGKKSEGRTRSAKSRFNIDIFTEPCMENAYYICHNVQDVLKCRGFPWPDAANKKKKGKKGK
ncbi:hypothetical protein RUM44_010441 [Polyplax serrata]|uniref:Small lysine-rich protein 1 n=1 Tax=Polyplax serrata TaxID=468196 RepID=A0ABR1AVH1_POLSC